MSAAPSRNAFGSDRAARLPLFTSLIPALLPRQVSGQTPAPRTHRTEPRPTRDDDFLQRLRESGL